MCWLCGPNSRAFYYSVIFKSQCGESYDASESVDVDAGPSSDDYMILYPRKLELLLSCFIL